MATRRTPLLYLTHRIPYPPDKGDKVRSFNILRHLARSHRVFLGTFVDDPDDYRHLETLKEWCAGVRAVVIEPRRRKLASLRALANGEALSLPYYRSPTLRRWAMETAVWEHISAALAFSGPMAQYLALPGLKKTAVDFCDVDSAKWTAYAASRRWPLSWLYRREGRLLADFERRAAQAATVGFFSTAAERELFASAAPDVGDKTRVMGNGVDAEYFNPEREWPNPYPPGGPVLLFTGAMDYWPNVDAVRWFAREILPLVRERRADARFWIVGRNPTAAVWALAGDAVTVTGAVPDVRPYLAHADVVEAPLRIARGIQNKVLEAMAMARAVVVADAPARGLGAKAGEECEVAANAETFAAATLRLLEYAGRRVTMGRQARAAVLARHGWEAQLAALDEVFDGDA
ncbi:MAG: TIGR03087 family PEP-CTERM/XrtA system glycosyltransferase [Azoarcus sp.]|jgi:sugar transferase (PEP-CTERM/EpsH1 system associated)|nr:TIGR03087 family PEP-CTERM/XrtA system glycosyltransferase [Azoarcus sp.]